MPPAYTPDLDIQQLVNTSVDNVFGADRPADLEIMIYEGAPAHVLLEVAEGALLLVIGSRGHGGAVGLLLGSVSAVVAERAHCPVLVAHAAHVVSSRDARPDAEDLVKHGRVRA